MKKFLSLVLALVMTMSLVTVAGAKDFTDAADVNYDEAVDVISALEVVGGYADGSFNPKGTLTRGAAAKIICNILVGPENAADLVANGAPYADVPANHTFAGYIAYCANEGIISGYADGTFKPAATLNGYAFLKMLLGALGYNTDNYTGNNWWVNVALDAKAAKLLEGLEGSFNGQKAVTREEACLFAFNALKADMVTFSAGDKITIGDIEITSNSSDEVKTGFVLREVKFDKLAYADSNVTDALGRKGHTWTLDGDKIGTYADAADLVLENAIDADDLKDIFDDLDVENKHVKASDTANGKTIEVFFNDDEDETKYVVEYAAALVPAQAKDKNKVSTSYDDRALKFAGLWVVADEDEVKKGTEIKNFEALYEYVDDADALADAVVLVIKSADGKEIFSAEIPEVVEAPISRVKGDKIVAGGEEYLLAPGVEASVSKDDVELTVGANGVVYAIDGIASEVSDVIYVDYVSKDTNKWGDDTYTAQIVDENDEIVEVVVDKSYAKGFYTYEINDDDEYELKAVTVKTADAAMDDEDTYVKFAGKKAYFADDMKVVYISETKADLEVTVKEGAQNVTGTHYVLNDDDDVAIVYVIGKYEDGESEDVVFLADVKADADVINDDGKAAKAYTAYIDGEEVEIMISNASKGAGFWTYTIDSKTGEYKLETAKGYFEKSVTITKDTYVSVDAIDDATVTGGIYDLTDEGLYTLADIADWDGDELVVSFMYDKDENEITALYVDFK